jgi:hypothetical protein
MVRQSLRLNVCFICSVYLGHSQGLDASTGLTTAIGAIVRANARARRFIKITSVRLGLGQLRQSREKGRLPRRRLGNPKGQEPNASTLLALRLEIRF